MTLNDFISKYDSSNNKEKFLEGRINNKYVSFGEKANRCKRIVENSSYIDIGGEKHFMVNSPARYLLFALTLFDLYTDIEVDYSFSIEFYDEINKRGLFDKVKSLIGEKEYSEFCTLLSMSMDDLMDNERSLVSYVDNKSKAIEVILDAFIREAKDAGIKVE